MSARRVSKAMHPQQMGMGMGMGMSIPSMMPMGMGMPAMMPMMMPNMMAMGHNQLQQQQPTPAKHGNGDDETLFGDDEDETHSVTPKKAMKRTLAARDSDEVSVSQITYIGAWARAA